MKTYPHIAMRVFNTPLLLMPEKAETIASILAERLGVEKMVERSPLAERSSLADAADAALDSDRPYQLIDGTAVIPVVGELVNRGSWLDTVSGLTSYEALGATLRAAVGDMAVSGIVLDIDSPGGEAAGAMETGALVRSLSAEKPITAFVNGLAASAGYAIAAGAPKIVVAPTATLGSIGVVWLHVDRTQQMAKAGLKPTLLKRGAYKTDGTSLEPLADEARQRIEGTMDVFYGLFASSVAAHRPSLSIDDARATEAGIYVGQHAVDAGLADAVGTLDDARRTSAPKRSILSFATSNTRGPNMTDVTQADHEAALSTATAAGVKTGVSSERTRVGAILAHAEAKGRESLAKHLAFETDMTPEAAAAVLKASPKPDAPADGQGSRLNRRDLTQKVEPDSEPGEGETSEYEQGAAAAKLALGIR